jgi:hypothetical protein
MHRTAKCSQVTHAKSACCRGGRSSLTHSVPLPIVCHIQISLPLSSSTSDFKTSFQRGTIFGHFKARSHHCKLFQKGENLKPCRQTLLGVAVVAETGLPFHIAQEVELRADQTIASNNVVGVGLIEGEVEETVADSVEDAVLRLQLKFTGLYFLVPFISCLFS